MISLTNKNAIITGGGSGIGRAVALLFAEAGAIVNIIDVDDQNGLAVSASIIEAKGEAAYHHCNIADQQAVTETVGKIVEQFGNIQVLVNNAGIAHIGNAENTSPEDFARVFDVNVKGVYNCLHAVLPIMKYSGGVILNLASVAGLVGIPDRFAYSASKGAVAAMTRSVAKDFLAHNIRCNSISPGRVHTPFVDGFLKKKYPGQESEMFEKLSKTQPIGRMAKPIEVAQLILFLCSDESAFITGCDYPIDGGFVTLNN